MATIKSKMATNFFKWLLTKLKMATEKNILALT